MKYGLILLATLVGGSVLWMQQPEETPVPVDTQPVQHTDKSLQEELTEATKHIREEEEGGSVFAVAGLLTDTSRASIALDEVLDGGPGKDGIPAIDAPVFLSIAEASEAMPYIEEMMQGIVVVGEQEARFYSYAIMNRHEIVNDVVDAIPIAVTFCPLCGSAIVFDRRVDGEVLRFGISGKLRQSNLLMYDDLTESLWSQARGEGVVGTYTDMELTHIASDVMTRAQFVEAYPQGRVLSDDTGYVRSYARAPYGDYDVHDQLYFPVSNTDVRLPKKEILYVVQDEGESIAFVRRSLQEAGEGKLDVAGRVYTATMEGGSIRVVNEQGSLIPGYHEMFFSRATQHPESKWLWEE